MKDKTDVHARVSRGTRPLARDISGATTCLVALAHITSAHGSSGTVTCPVAPAPAS
jgi:hypothetical protein